MIRARENYAHLGCPTCGNIRMLPHDPGDRLPWCIHHDGNYSWARPHEGTQAGDDPWTQMVRVAVFPAAGSGAAEHDERRWTIRVCSECGKLLHGPDGCDGGHDAETLSLVDVVPAKREAGPGGASLIAAERQRQITDEGWTAEHDDAEHLPGDLVSAAIAYAIYAWKHGARDASGNPSGWTEKQVLEIVLEQWWPFDADDWKPNDDPIRTLVKAGALVAAEIDRQRRAT